jgi:hypothetical protein
MERIGREAVAAWRWSLERHEARKAKDRVGELVEAIEAVGGAVHVLEEQQGHHGAAGEAPMFEGVVVAGLCAPLKRG